MSGDSPTGGLAISDNWYLQGLEGPVAAPDDLLRRLERDPWHCDLMILARAPAADRLFSGWSMASARVTPALASDLVALIDECRTDAEAATAALLRIVTAAASSQP